MANTKQLRILVVDDDPIILELFRDAFYFRSDQGEAGSEFDVECCDHGNNALKNVKKAVDRNEPFAVVFLDLNLSSGPDGIRTGEKIRLLDPNVNFVIMTGLLDIDPQDIALSIPPGDKILYVQKPLHIQEIRQFARALGAKWKTEAGLRKSNLDLENKYTELEQSKQELWKHKLELENLNNQLMETNNAMSILARNLEKARKESEKRILRKTMTLIIPIIERLQEDRKLQRHRTDLDLLDGYIKNMVSDLTGKSKMTVSFSTTETRVASMIKNGMSSEEIASHLYISLYTVKTHRKNIRKKLNIQNSGVNLRSYLESEPG